MNRRKAKQKSESKKPSKSKIKAYAAASTKGAAEAVSERFSAPKSKVGLFDGVKESSLAGAQLSKNRR